MEAKTEKKQKKRKSHGSKENLQTGWFWVDICFQVEKLAISIWGSIENIETEIDRREEKQDASRKKKVEKQVRQVHLM